MQEEKGELYPWFTQGDSARFFSPPLRFHPQYKTSRKFSPRTDAREDSLEQRNSPIRIRTGYRAIIVHEKPASPEDTFIALHTIHTTKSGLS